MIDIKTERLVTLRDVPKLLPPRPNGKHVHISAVYRWVQRGVRGNRLDAIRIGGTTYTSQEALQRFGSPPAESTVPQAHLSALRSRQIDRAKRRLDDLFGKTGNVTAPGEPTG